MTDLAQPNEEDQPNVEALVFQTIDKFIEKAGLRVGELRASNREFPTRISKATKQRTDSIIELAKHYLPELTHQTLASAWDEVHDQIRDLMLVRDDKCRRFQVKLDEHLARRDELGAKFERVQEAHEQARRDLLAKKGSFRKSLRTDPRIKAISQKIHAIDSELQKTISTLQLANENASEKLPDYQACELFNYLREKQFGTANYTSTGLVRRWDRWIATMVDYRQSNANYQYLTRTPIELSELIREKEQLYRHWLERLEKVRKQSDEERAAALDRFGIVEQERLWKSLGKEAGLVEAEWEEAKWDVAIIESDLETACSIRGKQHEEAVRIYADFLDKVEPEILRIYASCTESPVDDQIAARIRDFESEIDEAKRIHDKHHDQIVELEKLRSAFGEIAAKLRSYLRRHPIELKFRRDFQLDVVLGDLSRRSISPDKAWRQLQAAIIDPSRPTRLTRAFFDGQSHPTDAQDRDSLDVAFTNVAAELGASSTPPLEATNPSEILVHVADTAAIMPGQSMFRPLAVTYHPTNSAYIETLLAASGLRCFAHRDREDFSEIELFQPGAITVLVEAGQFDEARRVLIDELRQFDAPWDCSGCQSAVEKGFHQCWRCGQPKT